MTSVVMKLKVREQKSMKVREKSGENSENEFMIMNSRETTNRSLDLEYKY